MASGETETEHVVRAAAAAARPSRKKSQAVSQAASKTDGPADGSAALQLTLSLVMMTVREDEPLLAIHGSADTAVTLPRGPLKPRDAGLEAAARAVGHTIAGSSVAFVDQLNARVAGLDQSTPVVDVGYLALLPPAAASTRGSGQAAWQSIYAFLPWEDWRHGRPSLIDGVIMPKLVAWTGSEQRSRPKRTGRDSLIRQARIKFAFGADRNTWDETRVLERYDLLSTAGILLDGDDAVSPTPAEGSLRTPQDPRLGQEMKPGDRRLLARALARVRASIRTRPAIFELLENEFTLFEFQRTLEALLGPMAHKQNFRRQIETAGLVEPTGKLRTNTGGRPAKLYRFSAEVLAERPAPPSDRRRSPSR